MIVSYPLLPTSYAISSYGGYEAAREAEQGIVGEWFWLGIYDAGHQFEINQLMLGFDTTDSPNLPVTGITLELPIDQAYGLTRVLALHHEWEDDGVGAFIKGSEIESLYTLADFTVDESDTGSIFVKLDATYLPDIAKIGLVPADLVHEQYNGSGDDTTLIIENGIKLHVTYADAPPPVEAEVEGIIDLGAVVSASPVVDGLGAVALQLGGDAEAHPVVDAAISSYLPLGAAGAALVVNAARGSALIDLGASGEASGVIQAVGSGFIDLGASLVAQSVYVARGEATIDLGAISTGSPVSQATLSAPLVLIATATASMGRNIYWIDPKRVVVVPTSNRTAVVPHISTTAV